MKQNIEKYTDPKELTILHADVLVIGGGYAGNFAAIRAAEAGQKVIMAVKGRSGRSGLSPWANSFFVYKDTQGATREDYLKQFEWSGEYLCNMGYVEALMDESYQRLDELIEWGAVPGRSNYYQPGTVSRSVETVKAGDAMRGKVVASGVQLLERVMMTALIKPKDKVEGAIGFHMESGRGYAVMAKTTVMCTGPSSLKPLGYGYPCSSATADGDAMAYRVGGEISGKEFNDAHPDSKSNHFKKLEGKHVSGDGLTSKSPMELGGGPGGFTGPVQELHGDILGMRIDATALVNAHGLPLAPDAIKPPGMGTPKGEGYKTSATKAPEFEGDKMKGLGGGLDEGDQAMPPKKAPPQPAGYSTVGMSNHKAEGIFPQDTHGKTNVKHLWAAGDCLSTMQNGAGYAGFGCSSAGSSVQGHRAGIAAAEAAKGIEAPVADEVYLQGLMTEMYKPITSTKGYSPAWVIQLMQNIMFPYFVIYVKEKTRMECAISQLVYLQKKFGEHLRVDDFHGLRVAHECRNMLLNAEMKMRAGLAREESRGTHIREDFPFRDDKNFLCWIKLVQKEDGTMDVVKHPIPKEWHPKPGTKYRDRYPIPYPGEAEYLESHPTL